MNVATLERPQEGIKTESDHDILWAALEGIAKKQKYRDRLEPGGSHRIELELTGRVDDRRFLEKVSSTVSVGFDQQRSTSVTPNLPHLIGHILSKLNRQTRDKILCELPTDFEKNGLQLPDVGFDLVTLAEKMLRKLRAKKQITARGRVQCEYAFHD